MKYFLLIQFLFVYSCKAYCQKINAAQVELIKIIKVDLYIEGIKDISCDDFIHSFLPIEVDTIYVKNKKTINRVLHCINNSRKSYFDNGIDARGKMFIFYNNKKLDSICFSSTDFYYLNNQPFLLPNMNLFYILDELSNSKKKH